MKKIDKSTLNRLKGALKKENMRLTDQRLSIWKQINQSKKHLDVEDIFFQLRKKGSNVSRATIYRTLDVLVKNGLIRKMDLGGGHSLYEPKIKDEHHDHMICEDTGKIIEFVPAVWNSILKKEKLGRVLKITWNGYHYEPFR